MDTAYTLIRKAQNGDKLSEEQLIRDNIPLVRSLVKKLWREGLCYDDLMQLGLIGLLKALRRFDFSYGTAFSTYAVPSITGEIKRFLRDDGIIKLSRIYRENNARVLSAREHLKLKLMREPSLDEISTYTGIDKEQIILSGEACMPCDSLERSLTEDSSLTLSDTIESKEGEYDNIDILSLKIAMQSLDIRDKKIIVLRYFMGKTQAEVSKIIGVSQVQISRIEKRVIKTLKAMIE